MTAGKRTNHFLRICCVLFFVVAVAVGACFNFYVSHTFAICVCVCVCVDLFVHRCYLIPQFLNVCPRICQRMSFCYNFLFLSFFFFAWPKRYEIYPEYVAFASAPALPHTSCCFCCCCCSTVIRVLIGVTLYALTTFEFYIYLFIFIVNVIF